MVPEWDEAERSREERGEAERSEVRYKYVYQTAWWSWLSPFNKDRAPSWWRESRVPLDLNSR
jgi:hypothetical protein